MLAGDGDVRVHDLRPLFSRREISLGAYTMQSGSKVVVRVSDASWGYVILVTCWVYPVQYI